MPRIQVLPDLLVNKIAAGEVIERPASVVKELVENSLDAGARRIEIVVEQGGQRLIRVTDDGGGMDPVDLALSIRPHATSKIRQEEDLFQIRTMGFRGEALPSIGAVSQLRIVSRQPGADAAHEVRITGDKVEPITAAAAPPGTTVEVRELFFNVPARRKFMRTPQTEMGHITEQLARIALVHPEVEFRLTHNGRHVHHLRPAEGMLSRIHDFYGAELADVLIPVHRDERGLKITGYVAPPADSRSSAKWQYLFLNGRCIHDRFISHAVREAYRGLMEPSRYPIVFLALEIDPTAVDVNVHPTKSEVRWRDSNMLYSQILSALRDRFLNTDLTPSLRAGPGLAPPDTDADRPEDLSEPAAGDQRPAPASPIDPEDQAAEARRQQIRESIADFFKRSRPSPGPFAASGSPRPGPSFSARPFPSAPAVAPTPLEEYTPATCVTGFLPDDDRAGGTAASAGDFAAAEPAGPIGSVIQIHRSYLVAECPEGLVIIDQHALHERILFEQLSQQFARGPLESQRLLLPEIMDTSADQVGVIEIHADTLERLGFELSAYGPSAIAVHAAPSLLRPERTREFVRDMLDRLADRSGPASTELLVNDLLSMMACKAAVKAGDPLTAEEIASLMAKRPQTDRSSNCPHGRPTALRLSLKDLEREFKRT